MNREEVLEILQSHVRRGAVTTYRELSLFFYGDTQGTRAVGSALRALVAHDPDMTAWTNRVVASDGAAAVPGQLAQLADEQVPTWFAIKIWLRTGMTTEEDTPQIPISI